MISPAEADGLIGQHLNCLPIESLPLTQCAGAILRAVDWLTRKELIEDPLDPLAAHVTHLADRFSADSQHFYALYLLTHGLVKLVVVILLARRIAKFKLPERLEIVTSFPTSPAGKILRRELRRIVETKLIAESTADAPATSASTRGEVAT